MSNIKSPQVKLEIEEDFDETMEIQTTVIVDQIIIEEQSRTELKMVIKEEQNDSFQETENIPYINVKLEKDNGSICDTGIKTFVDSTKLQDNIETSRGCKENNKFVANMDELSNQNVKSHTRETSENIHSNLKIFSCDYCSKTFFKSNDLNDHVRRHLGIKSFCCEYCSKTFANSSELKNHVNRHLGVKPFSCVYCSKSFVRSSDLKKHTNSHLGVKPYTCNVCEKSFASSTNLKYHKKIHMQHNLTL